MTTKVDLDKRICDVEKDCDNTQTYREFIRESEKEFGIAAINLDDMTNYEINKYLEFIDYLQEK